MDIRTRVLFLCVGNSCRSQMAEGLLRKLGGDKFEAESAGTLPSHVHPSAIQVMAELGLDISDYRSKHVAEFSGEHFDYVISLCGENNCPSFAGKVDRMLHWPFPDPTGAVDKDVLNEFRMVRDAIKSKLETFINHPGSFATDGTDFIVGG